MISRRTAKSATTMTEKTYPLAFLHVMAIIASIPSLVTSQAAAANNCSTISAIACETEGFEILCEALTETGLIDDLDVDLWTVFAPTNEAFEELGDEALEALNNNTVALTDLLLFHTVPGTVLMADDLPCGAGSNLVLMSNGIDSRTLCVGSVATYQKGMANPDDALPQIVTTDIDACNGVIHVLDRVMLDQEISTSTAVTPAPTPSSDQPLPTPSDPTSSPEGGCLTIAEIVCATPDFTTLCSLVVDAGLDDDLAEGLWTVFAPNNEAFAKAADLLSDIDSVEEVLLFHTVANDKLLFDDLVCGELTEMTNGEDSRTICKGDGTTYQKGNGNSDETSPEIIATNLEACNGVIHVVDEVMLP